MKTAHTCFNTALVLLLLALLALPWDRVQADPVPVRVGGYVFPPFVNEVSGGRWSGLTLDVLGALNRMQDQYEFVFYPTSARRRFRDFKQGHYDVMLFESPQWGWQHEAVDSLPSPLAGREVFIARAVEGRGQEYFNDRQGKRIALFSGYHYAFAGFDSDREYLRTQHNAVMTFSHESKIRMVLRGRVELSVVGETFLEHYLAKHPVYREQLLISQEPDQEYRHALIVRRGAQPEVALLGELFAQLDDSGELARLLARHGITDSD